LIDSTEKNESVLYDSQSTKYPAQPIKTGLSRDKFMTFQMA